jgi:hypothetical protein
VEGSKVISFIGGSLSGGAWDSSHRRIKQKRNVEPYTSVSVSFLWEL